WLAAAAPVRMPAGDSRGRGESPPHLYVAAIRRRGLLPAQRPLQREDQKRRRRWSRDRRLSRSVPAAAPRQPARAARRISTLQPGGRYFHGQLMIADCGVRIFGIVSGGVEWEARGLWNRKCEVKK